MISALALGAALVSIVLLSACSGGLSAALKADGGASIALQAEIPASLAARFRTLSGGDRKDGKTRPLFDEEAIRSSLASRPSLTLRSLSFPSPDSLSTDLVIRSLDELAASPDLREAELLTITRGPGWTELRIKLARSEASSLASIFPGIDPYLIDALSPPALEEEPLSAEEYRINLKTVLGKTAMSAMEAAAMTLGISAPGTIISSGGGGVSGSTLTARIPIIDILVLEKPIELWLRWKS